MDLIHFMLNKKFTKIEKKKMRGLILNYLRYELLKY